MQDKTISRREALMGAACIAVGATIVCAAESAKPQAAEEPIIDIHQHTTYRGRSDEALLHHQKKMGITQTILLPGGRPVTRASTLNGRANGLEAAAGDVNTVMPIVKAHPGEYYFGANDVPDLPDSREQIVKQIKDGAICIGEQKFNLPVDGPEMEMIYRLAEEYDVPLLMHFQAGAYNTGYERFGKVLAKWPKVKFVAHAQTFWANIDANNVDDPKSLYPKGPVKAGGLSDKYLSDYANFFGDMSAGSGLSAMTRDEDHARGFLDRHQDKLMYGSDCPDGVGEGPQCTGASMIKVIRRLAPSKEAERKILYGNAKKHYKL